MIRHVPNPRRSEVRLNKMSDGGVRDALGLLAAARLALAAASSSLARGRASDSLQMVWEVRAARARQ